MMTWDDLPVGTVLNKSCIKLNTGRHHLYKMSTIIGVGGMHGPEEFIPDDWSISFLPVEFLS